MSARYAFVLGTGCSGSSLVQELLSRHQDVGFVSNLDDRLGRPSPLARWNASLYRRVPQDWTRKGRVRFAPSEGYRLLDRQVSPVVAQPGRSLREDDAWPALAEHMRTVFDRSAARQRRAVFVHKFTGYSRVGFLRAVFPDAQFIHVVRDGRAVAASFLRQAWWMGESGRGATWTWTGMPPADRELWESSGRSWPVLAGLQWRRFVTDLDADGSQLPADRWLEVRYEDLLADPEEALGRMLGRLRLGLGPEFRASVAGYRLDGGRVDGFRRELAPRDIEQLESLLGPELRRFGYGSATAA